jgi:hypothetical protein
VGRIALQEEGAVISAELLLTLLIVGLYLNDSTTLLRADEGVLELRPRGRWVASFATRRFTLLGKHVYVGGLIPPNTLLFKLAWAMECEMPEKPGWERAAPSLHRYQWAGAFMFVLVMVLLPAALLTKAGDTVAIVLIAAIYASILAVALALWLDRKPMGLTPGHCFRLIAEMLLCPPVAANLPRRLSLQVGVDEDFVSAGRRLLQPPEWAAAAGEIGMRIEDEIEAEGAGTSRHTQLSQRRAGLA